MFASRLFRLACCGLWFPLLPAQTLASETFAVTPKAGFWQGSHQVLVNGQDLLGELDALQQKMLASLPAEQRQLVAAMLPKKQLKQSSECLTAAQVSQLTTPQQWLSRARQLLPNCQLELTGHSRNSVSVQGNCQNQRGYTGTVAGQLQLVSDSLMNMQMRGTGQYQLAGAPVQPAAQQGPVQFELTAQSRWQGSQCPAKGQ